MRRSAMRLCLKGIIRRTESILESKFDESAVALGIGAIDGFARAALEELEGKNATKKMDVDGQLKIQG